MLKLMGKFAIKNNVCLDFCINVNTYRYGYFHYPFLRHRLAILSHSAMRKDLHDQAGPEGIKKFMLNN